MLRIVALLCGWACVLLFGLWLNDEPDCTGVSEGGECVWRAGGDFWAFMVLGMVAVAITVFWRKSLLVRIPLAVTAYLVGAAVYFMG